MRTRFTLTIAATSGIAILLSCLSIPASAQDQNVEPGSEPSPIFTSTELSRRTVERRAVEAAIWGMPLVNVDAMRQEYFRVGAKYNDVIFWSNPNTWMNQTTTPNHSTSYVIFFVNLKNGPVVVNIPAAKEQALYGTLINSWNEPQLNVGNTGYDKGKGAKYVMLPPGYKGKRPAGYVPVHFSTYNAYCLLRIIVKTHSAEDMKAGIDYLHTLKVYPLAKASLPAAIQFIDVSSKPFDAAPVFDASFYTSLARMVNEETLQERDLAIMGQLRSLGIGKKLTFKPDAALQLMLARAAEEAHQWLMEGFVTNGDLIWPQSSRTWHFILDLTLARGSKLTFIEPGQDLRIDERGFAWFAMYGPPVPPPPQLYIKAVETKDGERLNGSHMYRLRIPANVPAKKFWAVDVYDATTGTFIRESPVVGIDSYDQALKRNADGTVDVYFASTPLEGQESNWIMTKEGRPFFIMFRFYGPETRAIDGSWALNDIEQVK